MSSIDLSSFRTVAGLPLALPLKSRFVCTSPSPSKGFEHASGRAAFPRNRPETAVPESACCLRARQNLEVLLGIVQGALGLREDCSPCALAEKRLPSG